MKKIATVFALLGALVLAGCKTTEDDNKVIVTTQKGYVVEIPAELLQCKLLQSYPNPEQLTDAQISAILIQLAKENEFCANNMAKIKQFIARAKATIR